MKNVIRTIIAWLFASVTEELKELLITLFVEKNSDALKRARPKAYVTVRGTMLRTKNGELSKTKYAWTQSAAVDAGDSATVNFDPMMPFELEQVDVLGPATILQVQVGNLIATRSPFEAPATVEVKELCEVGCSIRVMLKGLP